MSTSAKTVSRRRPSALPAGWDTKAGRVVPPSPATQTSAAAPARRAPAGQPPKGRGTRVLGELLETDAAEEQKCGQCGALIPMTDPPAKFCPSCGAELPPPEEDADQPPPEEPAAAAASAFARHAMSLTGTRSLDAAKGTLAAWKEAAGKAGTLAAELGEKSARLATVERERVLEAAVAEGRLSPAEAWSFTVVDGKKVRSFSEWAGPSNARGTGQSLEQLQAFVAQRAPNSTASSPTRHLTPGTGERPGAQASNAAPPGVDPATYAAASAQVAELLGD